MVAKIVRVPAKARLWEQAELAARAESDESPSKKSTENQTHRSRRSLRTSCLHHPTDHGGGGILKEGFAWKKPTVFSTAEVHAIFSRKFQYWSRGVFFVRRTARLQRDFTVNVHLSNASVRLFFLKRLFALTKTFQFDQPEK